MVNGKWTVLFPAPQSANLNSLFQDSNKEKANLEMHKL